MDEKQGGGAFGVYWRALRTPQRAQLLAQLGPSASAVKFIASGRRGMSVEMAARLEAAMQHVDGIAPLTRMDMRPECASCPHRACGLVLAQGGAQ